MTLSADEFAPKPRTIDPDVKHFGTYTIPAATVVNRAMDNGIKAACKLRGISRSEFLRKCIERELNATSRQD